ncbi:leukocidin family pore-forming toxin [Algicola sagamiensis]|uniref:leukocidin family pore-forming toxin n=1 Tax=Algicola sagamiensis TaxID=163869 RepID=UPI00036957FB|nr:leukocidin family pore-forming toxin [Algicola sagamiensis]
MKIRKIASSFQIITGFTLLGLSQAHASTESPANYSPQIYTTSQDHKIGYLSNPGQLTQKLLQQEGWSSQLVMDGVTLSEVALLVIHPESDTDNGAHQLLREAIRKKKNLMLQLSSLGSEAQRSAFTAQYLGIGLSDPIVLVHFQQGEMSYQSISIDGDPQLQENQQRLIDEVTTIVQSWEQEPKRRTKRSTRMSRLASAAASGEDYKPEATIPIEFRRINVKCRVGKEFDGNGWSNTGNWNGHIEDACNGEGSVSLFYTLDFIRSVPYNGGGDNNADDAKYLRVTLNPEKGSGSGWHLVDKPRHEHTWFESWTNRLTWFGPIAMDYGVEVYSSDPEVRLYTSMPNNKPKESDIRDVTGFSVGVSGGLKAEVGDKGPTVGGDIKADYSYNSSRWVSYKIYEYTLENQSKAGHSDKARWLWDRKWDEYSKHWRTNDTCALWCSDWFFKDSEFTAAAYANYKPGFSATFRVNSDKQGKSLFTISNKVTIAALGGRVQYMGFLQGYTPWSYSGTEYTFNKHFEVNWDAAVFEPERNVSIEAFRYSSAEGVCLDVAYGAIEDGAAVVGYACNYDNNQLWGLDNYQRYKSRVAPNRCLTANDDGSLTVNVCTAAANQKWRWENDQLVNELGGNLSIVDGDVKMSKENTHYNAWRNYVRNIEPDKILSVY